MPARSFRGSSGRHRVSWRTPDLGLNAGPTNGAKVPNQAATACLASTRTRTRLHVAEFDKKHPSPASVLGDLEEVHESRETRAAGERRSDVGKRHLEKRRHHDFSRREGVPTPDPDVRPLPKPDAAGNLPAADSIPQDFDELHGPGASLRLSARRLDPISKFLLEALNIGAS